MPTPFEAMTVVSSADGPQLTVNSLLKSPTVIPRRIIDITSQRFIADQILRAAPQAPSGVVQYWESNPLFADTDSEPVREYGEIPVTTTSVGDLFVVQVVKRALGLRISREMADRNAIDLVNLKIQQVSNTLVQDWDLVFMNALVAAIPSSHTAAASSTWDGSTPAPRKDILTAAQSIIDEKRGFTPNTLIIPVDSVVDLVANDDTWKAWVGNVADQSPAVTGRLPNKIFGFDVWTTYNLAAGTAIVCERGTCGFISDERPLQSTPMRYIEDTETWRNNTIRSSAVGIDQPLATALITGTH